MQGFFRDPVHDEFGGGGGWGECVLMNCVFFNLVYRVLLRRGDIIILT